jgi:hypothetical protein
MYRETIATYCQNVTKPISVFCGQTSRLVTIKALDVHTRIYLCVVKDLSKKSRQMYSTFMTLKVPSVYDVSFF